MTEQPQVNLLDPLADLWRWLEAIRAPAVIVGGVAVSFLGRTRFTQDIDALAIVAESEWEAALATASAHGLVPRIENPLDFARDTRVLLLRHVRSAISMDVILGELPFEQAAVRNGITYAVGGGISIRLPQIEDLVIMKAVAHRPHDLQDIRGLLDMHPDLDVAKVRRWVAEFATATAMSDILRDFDALLESRR